MNNSTPLLLILLISLVPIETGEVHQNDTLIASSALNVVSNQTVVKCNLLKQILKEHITCNWKEICQPNSDTQCCTCLPVGNGTGIKLKLLIQVNEIKAHNASGETDGNNSSTAGWIIAVIVLVVLVLILCSGMCWFLCSLAKGLDWR